LWESRKRGRYYYRCRRRGDRVIKSYLGRGPIADVAAYMDDAARELRRAHRAEVQAARARDAAMEAQLVAFDEACRLAVEAHLRAAGFNRSRSREWRRPRVRPTPA
jgi:hypothetical protein